MVDFFRKNGKAIPIRSSPSYEDAFGRGLSAKDKDYLRHGEDGTGAYTFASPGREERIAEAKARRQHPRKPGPYLHPSVQEQQFVSKPKPRDRW